MQTTRALGVICGVLFTATASIGCDGYTPPPQDPSSVDDSPPSESSGSNASSAGGDYAGAADNGSGNSDEGDTASSDQANVAGDPSMPNPPPDAINAEMNRQVNGILDATRPSSRRGGSSQRHTGSKGPGAACLSDGECASGDCGRCGTGAATCFCN